MKCASVRLLSVTWPFCVIPLLDVSVDQIGPWFTGTEFRLLVSQVITQILGGLVGALLQIFVFGLFGVSVTGG